MPTGMSSGSAGLANVAHCTALHLSVEDSTGCFSSKLLEMGLDAGFRSGGWWSWGLGLRMAGGMLGLRTVTLDIYEVFLLARWNIHNF